MGVAEEAAESAGGGGKIERRGAAKQGGVDVLVDEGRCRRREHHRLDSGVGLHAGVFDRALKLREKTHAVFRDADDGGRDDLEGRGGEGNDTAKTNSRERATFLTMAWGV